MTALVLQQADGSVYVSFPDPSFDLDEFVDACREGLKLLNVVKLELRDKTSKIVRRI